jgi:putative ABC transport system permease protein
VGTALALRMALKGLLRAAGTTSVAVGILAVGLAAPAIFFSLLVGAIRPLPVPEGTQVVRIEVLQTRQDIPLDVLPADLTHLHGLESLTALGAFRTFSATLVDRETAATRVAVGALTPDVLPLLRVGPEIGRLPRADEAGRTLLLGHDIWTDIYASDPSVVGRTVEVEGVTRTVVGVMPDGFGFPFKQNAWLLIDPSAPGSAPIELVGRLADGFTLEAATAEVAVRWAQADEARPPDRRGAMIEVARYTRGRGEAGEAVAFLGLVLIALCLLIIACANVANLLLVRASERVRALGVQAALGAGRAQIGLQLFLEALFISALGGVLGLVIASAAVEVIQSRLGAEHWGYFWMRMAVDGTVVSFVAILVLGTALLAGTLPIIRVLDLDVQSVLRQDSSGAIGRRGVWGRVFVTAQLTLSCAALTAAGLTARSMTSMRSFAGDLPTDEVLLASMDLPGQTAERARVMGALTAKLAGLAGTEGAALAIGAPGFFEPWGPVEMSGVSYDRPEDRDRVNWNAVTPGYFGVFSLRLRAGRALAATDDNAAAPVAVVNESFTRRFSPDQPVLGRSLRIGARPDSATWYTVVGVVEDARVGQGERVRHERVYLPLGQVTVGSIMALLRASDDPAAIAPELRRSAASVDTRLSLSGIRTLADAHAYLTRIPRAMGALALGGGLAGLLVAAVGLYGMLAFRVRQRWRELGVRLALGADGGRLAREIFRWALEQLVPAVVIGLALAWLAAPALEIMLLGMKARSPSTFLGVGIAFLTVGLVASAVPAMRAARTNPAAVLRGE